MVHERVYNKLIMLIDNIQLKYKTIFINILIGVVFKLVGDLLVHHFDEFTLTKCWLLPL